MHTEKALKNIHTHFFARAAQMFDAILTDKQQFLIYLNFYFQSLYFKTFFVKVIPKAFGKPLNKHFIK